MTIGMILKISDPTKKSTMEKINQKPVKFSMFHEQFDRNYYTTGYTFDRVENNTMVFVRISDPLRILRVKPEDFLAGLRNKLVGAFHWYSLVLNNEMSEDEVLAFVRSLVSKEAHEFSNF